MAKSKEKISAVESARALREALKENVPPVVLLHGAEDFLIEESLGEIEKKFIDPATRDFNFSLLYGSDADISALLREAMSFPVMAEKKVVIVREFEKLRGSAGAESPLLKYLENPCDTTLLVLVAVKVEFNKHPFIALKKSAACFEFPELEERGIASWLVAHAKKNGYELDGGAAEMLAALSGGSLRAAAQEFEKLSVYVGEKKGARITAHDVELVACGDERFTIFSLQDAIGARKKKDAVTILEKMLAKGEEPLMMIAMISRYIMQLAKAQSLRTASQADAMRSLGVPPFVVKKLFDASALRSRKEILRAIHALADGELTLKSRATDSRVVMSLLLQEIL